MSQALCIRRNADRACGDCARECPRDAIGLHTDGIRIGEECVGCGRCAAVCPTAALSMRGSPFGPQRPGVGRTLCVDCERVAAGGSGPPQAHHRVVCFGALDEAALLELSLARGDAPVLLLNRGLCRDCPAGGGEEPPGGAARAAVAGFYAALGCGARAPVLHAPAAGTARRDDWPDRLRARRSFLNRFAGASARAESRTPPSAGAKRLRTVALMEQAARTVGRPLPSGLLPRIAIGEGCRDQNVCVAICPTGALTRYEDDERRGVRFNPRACIDCRLCESVCPEKALAAFGSGGDAAANAITLTAHLPRVCERCDELFAAFDDASECPACRKNDALFSTPIIAERLRGDRSNEFRNEEIAS